METTDKKLPIYALVINPTDESGVDFVALVDNPAIEKTWMAFNEQFSIEPNEGETKDDYIKRCIPIEVKAGKAQDQAIAICENTWSRKSYKASQFAITSQEKRIVTGALMIPDLLIYRKDEKLGEYRVFFSKDTIWQIVQKYFKNGFTSNVNMMHNGNMVAKGVYMIESFVVDSQRGIQSPTCLGNLPEGSWVGTFKVDNPEIWNDYVKTGVFRGFSVEGIFEHKYLVEKPESQNEAINNKILNLRAQIEVLKKLMHKE